MVQGQQIVGRPADVGFDCAPRRGSVAPAQGLDGARMIVRGLERGQGSGVQAGVFLGQQEVEHRPDLQPHVLHELQRCRHVRGGIDREVELLVALQIALDVPGRDPVTHVVVQALDLVNLRRRDPPARLFGQHALEGDPDVPDLVQALRRQQGHDHAAIGPDHECLLGHQSAQRGPHRHGTGAEGVGQGPQRHHVARREVPFHQGLAQLPVDALLERAAVDRCQTGTAGG